MMTMNSQVWRRVVTVDSVKDPKHATYRKKNSSCFTNKCQNRVTKMLTPETPRTIGRFLKESIMRAKTLDTEKLPYRPHFRSQYCAMIRPILWMQVCMGWTPYHMKSGEMRYSFKSIPFAYAVALTLLNCICHVYYHQEVSYAWFQMLGTSVNFSNVLFSMLIITQPFVAIVMVYSWFYEVPSIVECYNSTAVLEKKISDIFPTSTLKPFTRRSVTFLMALFLLSLKVMAYFLLVGRYAEAPLLVLLLFIVNSTVTYSHSVLWCYNFYFISDLAMKLKKHMLLVRENCAFKVKICRKIWISIWKQSQNYANSIAVTISFSLITNGTLFVIGCYGMIGMVRSNNILEVLQMLPYVGVTFIHMSCLFELPYRATYRLGNDFLNTMTILDRDAVDHECIEEIDKFVATISHTRNAAITLKDYMTMDRTLLVSFLSYSITYLIVLIQFQDTTPFSTGVSISTKNNTDLE